MKMTYSLTLLLLFALLPGCSHRTPADSDLFNQNAGLAIEKLPQNPLQWRVITSFIDTKQNTMSTLYGNDIAVTSARSGSSPYPAGAVLSLVTWTQRDDPHWFGARIPDHVQSVEFVSVGGNPGAASYQRFVGQQLEPQQIANPAEATTRQSTILALRASTIP